MKTIYYDNNGPKSQQGFRGGGSAWWVRLEPDRPLDEHFREFDISEQLYWGLFHLGLIDAFRKLPNDGFLDAYEEGVLFSSGLVEAEELLRKQARTLTASAYEWRCGKQVSPEKVEYRIVVDSAVLQEEILALANFLATGASLEFSVQLWL